MAGGQESRWMEKGTREDFVGVKDTGQSDCILMIPK